MEIKSIFLRLVETGSPFGFEEPMIRLLKSELEPYVDEVYDTPRGNVVGVQKGSDPEGLSVALVAHMDQVGFYVFNIDEKGFIRFRKAGWPVHRAILGQQVKILKEKAPVFGVVGVKPGHITKPEEMNVVPPIEEMYIDVGARSREETEAMGVHVGSPIVIHAPPLELANNLIASPAVDDRAGLTALIAVAEALSKQNTPTTIYYVGSIEEEGGFQGADVALFNLNVDFAVAIDTAPSGWQPDIEMRDVVYEVGKGPAIHIGEIQRDKSRIYHQKLRRWLIDTAEAEKILYQSSIMLGGTDASALAQTRSGLPTTTIGVPRRYSHSPVEVFDLNDLENLVKILVAGLKKIDGSFTLNRV